MNKIIENTYEHPQKMNKLIEQIQLLSIELLRVRCQYKVCHSASSCAFPVTPLLLPFHSPCHSPVLLLPMSLPMLLPCYSPVTPL